MSARNLQATTRGVAGIELRRTGAWSVAASLTVIGAVLIAASQPPLSQYGNWSSSWAAAMERLSTLGLVLGPLAGAAAAWVGGREGRRQLGELLASTPRPALTRRTTTWAALTAGLLLGTAAAAGLLFAGIAPTVSYSGGRWPASLLLALLGIVVCASLGFAAGHLVPGRFTAPAVAVLIYLTSGVASYLGPSWGGFIPLLPVAQLPSSEGRELIDWVTAVATVWFLALTAAGLLLAGARLRTTAAIPALVALLAAVPLAAASPDDGAYVSPWTQADPRALQPVCTPDVPQVCVAQVHAGLLDDVAPVARDLLANVQTYLPLDRAVEIAAGQSAPPGALAIGSLEGRSRFLRPGLAHPERVVEDAVFRLTMPQCPGQELNGPDQRPYVSMGAAQFLLSGGTVQPSTDPAIEALHTRLTADPDQAHTWINDFMPAAAGCDVETLARLAQP